jgi:hypothetical protein
MVCLHKRGFSVSDAAVASDTAQKIGLFLSLDAAVASDTAQKIGLFLSLDAAVASDTENHCPCK